MERDKKRGRKDKRQGRWEDDRGGIAIKGREKKSEAEGGGMLVP